MLEVEKTLSLSITPRWPKDQAEPLVRELLKEKPDMELLELIALVEQGMGLTLSKTSAWRIRQYVQTTTVALSESRTAKK